MVLGADARERQMFPVLLLHPAYYFLAVQMIENCFVEKNATEGEKTQEMQAYER